MMMKYTWVIRALFLFFAGVFSDSSFGQIFTGRVIDSQKAVALPYANIFVRGKSVGGITDIRGHFAIDMTKSSLSDSVVISYLGYESISIPRRQITSGFYDIELSPVSYQLDEVIALGKRRILFPGSKPNRQR